MKNYIQASMTEPPKEAPPMKPEIKQYFQEKYSKAAFSVVPGHWPDFKSREEVDEWIIVMEKITAVFRREGNEN